MLMFGEVVADASWQSATVIIARHDGTAPARGPITQCPCSHPSSLRSSTGRSATSLSAAWRPSCTGKRLTADVDLIVDQDPDEVHKAIRVLQLERPLAIVRHVSLGRNELELRLGIDEAPDQPRAR